MKNPESPSGRRFLVLLHCVAGALSLPLQASSSDDPKGWPVQLGVSTAGFSPPAVGDIDGDGDLEILAVVGDPLSLGDVREGIYAFHHDGTEVLDGDQDPTTRGVLLPLDFSPGFLRTPLTLGNLDSDPELEILCFGPHELHALNGDGTPVPGWPVHFDGTHHADEYNAAPIMVADIDADGENDVIFTSGAVPGELDLFSLQVLTASGVPHPGWPVQLHRETFGARIHVGVVADISEDPRRKGHLEIVVGSDPLAFAAHQIAAFDSGGGQLWSFSIAAIDLIGADMDGDGLAEILAVEVPRVERGELVTSVVMIDGRDRLLCRYPIAIGPYHYQLRVQGEDYQEREAKGFVGAHPFNEKYPDVLMVGLVDGDATPEVVLSTRYMDVTATAQGDVNTLTIDQHRGRIHVIDLVNGRSLPNFPIVFDYNQVASPDVTSPERLVDIDQDGRMEVLCAEYPEAFEKRLTAWSADGDLVFAESLLATTEAGTFMLEPVLRRGCVLDIDQDGVLDYATSVRLGELHLFGIPERQSSSAASSRQGWSDYRHDVRRTGLWRSED